MEARLIFKFGVIAWTMFSGCALRWIWVRLNMNTPTRYVGDTPMMSPMVARGNRWLMLIITGTWIAVSVWVVYELADLFW
jgi:hypothetical protein